MENLGFLEKNHPVQKFLPCTNILRNFKHFNLPGLNAVTEELIGDRRISPEAASECYHPPLLNIGRPIPCLLPRHVEEQDNPKEDLVMQLVRKKYFWRRRKKQLQTPVNRLTVRPILFSELVRAMRKNETLYRLPYAIVRMTDHLKNNPDKHFKGLYHWYYGNTMKNLTIKKDTFLLYPSGKNLNELCMALLERSGHSEVVPTFIPQVSMTMPTSGLIYDVLTDDSNGTIGVRQRDACSFLNYYEDCDGIISFRNFLTVKSAEYPYVAMDNCDTEFCTVNANRSVQFWTPDYLTHCVEHTTLPPCETKSEDKFVQIKYDSDHSTQIFVVVDRHNIYFYDKRESYREPCSHLQPDKQTEACEEISLLIPSVKEKTWYLGMNHSCLLLDTRMGFVEKWTHMMTQPPSLGHTFRENKKSNSEVVVLSTQATNEIVALYHSDNEPKVTYLPVRVPSRLDTLQEAHMNGVLTNLHLKNKFTCSMIGLTSYKMKKRMGILSVVSTGDIFHQYLEPTSDGFDENSTSLYEAEFRYLENWEHEFKMKYVNQKRNLAVTRNVDFSDLVDSIDDSIEIPSWETRAPLKNASWKLRIKDLHEYKDMLAPYILNEYGVDDIEDSCDDCENDPHSAGVQNWLLQNHSKSQELTEQDENDAHSSMFAISTLHEEEEDDSVLDPIIELDVLVPPKYDLEKMNSQCPKRRRRR